MVVPVGTDGKVSLLNGSGRTDALIDIVGYHPMSGGSKYASTQPQREVDTRITGDPLQAGRTRTLSLDAVPGNASGVVLNLTSVQPAGGGWLTVTAGSAARGGTSSLNLRAGRITSNRAYVGICPGGTVDLFASVSGDVLVDVVGWFGPTGLRYVPLLPIRGFDSRTGQGGASTLVGGRPETISLQAAGLPRAARRWS